MKRIRKVLIYGLIAIFSVVSLSSCSFFERALQKLGFGDETSTIATEPSRSNEPYTPSSIDNSKEESKITPTSKVNPTEESKLTPTSKITPTQGSSATSTTSTTKATSASDDIVDEYILDYGYNDLSRYAKKDVYMDLYKTFDDFLHDFYFSTADVSSKDYTVGSTTDSYYEIGEIEYTEYDLESYEALSVFKSVLLDHPEYYFISNTVLNYDKKTNDVITNRYLKIMIDEEYKLGSVRTNYKNKINEFLSFYQEKIIPFDTEYDKVKAAYDYIIENASYAYEADGKTPSSAANHHNMIGIVTEKKGVCESYAELFTFLLKSVNIGAITVSGQGYTTSNPTGENHAWNYVKIDDKYYGFDLTWGDTAGRSNYFGMSYNSLCYGKTSGCGRHIETESNIKYGFEYLYKVPSCSTVDLEYVL